jgi:hypothetical protein
MEMLGGQCGQGTIDSRGLITFKIQVPIPFEFDSDALFKFFMQERLQVGGGIS